MSFARWNRLPGMAVGLFALACGGDGGGGGTGPPGPPTQVVKSGGDAQSWYFNNPLPNPYSITVRDANNRTVPGVSVDWAVVTGGGTLAPDPSTTISSGVASTTHTLSAATTYVVSATVTGLPPVMFGASASAPPTTAAVSIGNNFFSPQNVVIQSGGTVTWTWNSGGTAHNVTYGSGPMPLPANSATQGSGTHSSTITAVGRYTYDCTIHSGMSGSVTVVN